MHNEGLKSVPSKVVGAAFELAILQILSPWFECTMRGLNRFPSNQDGVEPHFDPSILILARDQPFHNASLSL